MIYEILALSVLVNLIVFWFQPADKARDRFLVFIERHMDGNLGFLFRFIHDELTCTKCLGLLTGCIYGIVYGNWFVFTTLVCLFSYLITNLILAIESRYE